MAAMTVTDGPRRCPGILIVSVQGDLHSHAIQNYIINRIGIKCCIVEVDKIAYSGSISISISSGSVDMRFTDSEGMKRDLSEFSTVWWRRGTRRQFLRNGGDNLSEAAIDLINNDCSFASMGGFLASFSGRWVNEPIATSLAEDKIRQLKVASRQGIRIPKTLVSQDPVEVREFVKLLGGKAVIKPVKGTTLRGVLSAFVGHDEINDTAVRVAPAIYQEVIQGAEHYRVNIFGDGIFNVSIRSRQMDWRGMTDVEAKMHPLDNFTSKLLLNIMAELNLRMGIVDLKLDPCGEIVWLEVNPQGQFLFLEPLTGFDFIATFSEYLSGLRG